ncbi:unnamed protein product [Kuraishia capsulata CBS 1993]|uniref:Uncharacterized protein n=1 Tax=Kuraishia capsulata CBS 1993 TaxID=1382522 RepID=W6MTY6_9ASCO|nr:uncharacterized protein KUCA_T00005978001 [Kuraishia capsulata CBS 1993]CDK29983.1 unnamed protein product [Kuraishia capsulata CBS 1993]
MTLENPPFVAEFLPRIQRLSVSIQLAEELESCSLSSADELQMTVKGGARYAFTLPHPVVEVSNLVDFVQNDGFCKTLKLPTPILQSDRVYLDKSNNVLMTKEPKWDHNELARRRSTRSNTLVRCANCGLSLLNLSQVTTLRGMPSEIWAEMMEYWHCHKPDEGNKTNSTVERYGNFTPSPGGLLVGPYYFLVDKSILHNVGEDAECLGCDSVLGETGTSQNCLKMNKWSLELYDGNSETFQPYLHALNSLENSVGCTSSRYFIVELEKSKLLVWVFGYGIGVSSLFGHGKGVVQQNCLKVFYTDDEAQIEKFRSEKSQGLASRELEVLDFPSVVMVDLIEKLRIGTSGIPDGVRKFGFWNVSYLGPDL